MSYNSKYTSAEECYLAAAAFNKAALFIAIWLSFFSTERLPDSRFVANFKNCTSNLEVVLFFLSFLFKRVTPMVSNFNVFKFLRSGADSNRCKRFCRPLPSHSATRPIFKAAKITIIYWLPSLFLLISEQNNAVAIATFNDSAFPVRGIVTALSIKCSTCGRRPLPSFPIIISPSAPNRVL